MAAVTARYSRALADVVFEQKLDAQKVVAEVRAIEAALTESPACQTPTWVEPIVTTRALWLWSMSGANVPQPLVGEALYMGTQDNGLAAAPYVGVDGHLRLGVFRIPWGQGSESAITVGHQRPALQVNHRMVHVAARAACIDSSQTAFGVFVDMVVAGIERWLVAALEGA